MKQLHSFSHMHASSYLKSPLFLISVSEYNDNFDQLYWHLAKSEADLLDILNYSFWPVF